jgi:hypothetical protein
MKFTRRPDLDPQTRVEIVKDVWAHQGIYGKMSELAQAYRISRTFLYQLSWAAKRHLEELFSDPQHVIESPELILEPWILMLRLEGKCSIPSMASMFKYFDYQPNSVGYLSQYLQDYGRYIPSSLSMAEKKMVFYLSDEIFAIGVPILVTLEAQSTAILKIERAADRSAQTWQRHFEELGNHLFHSIGMASDRGTGLIAGYQAACQDGRWVCDQFHEFQELCHRCQQLERKAYRAIAKEHEATDLFQNAKSESNLQNRLEQYERAHDACEQAMARYDQLSMLLQWLRETLHLCSPLGRLHTVAGVRCDLSHLLDLIEEVDDAQLTKLLKPIRSHLDDILVPFEQVESIHGDLLERMPEQVVDALVLAWHHDHLSYQCHGKKKHAYQQQSQQWLAFAEGLLDDQFEFSQSLVFEKLDSVVKASSLVEMVNSLLRPYLNNFKGQITQETLNLIMFYHNHRRYKSGRRQGKAPIELLTGETLAGNWVELLMQYKREASTKAGETSSPALDLVTHPSGLTSPTQTVPEPAPCEFRTDANHPWQAPDKKAA